MMETHLTMMGATVSPESPTHLPPSPEPGRWVCDIGISATPRERHPEPITTPRPLERLEVRDSRSRNCSPVFPPAPFHHWAVEGHLEEDMALDLTSDRSFHLSPVPSLQSGKNLFHFGR